MYFLRYSEGELYRSLFDIHIMKCKPALDSIRGNAFLLRMFNLTSYQNSFPNVWKDFTNSCRSSMLFLHKSRHSRVTTLITCPYVCNYARTVAANLNSTTYSNWNSSEAYQCDNIKQRSNRMVFNCLQKEAKKSKVLVSHAASQATYYRNASEQHCGSIRVCMCGQNCMFAYN